MPTKPRGYAHRKRRAELIPHAIGERCPLGIPGVCDGVMTDPRRMQLDHTIPVHRGNTGPGDRIVCAPCNQSKGATEGNRRRRRRPSSRDW